MKTSHFKRYAAVAAALAVMIILPFMFKEGNQAKAMTLLDESIRKVEEVRTMMIKFFVRTYPNDNFDYIQLDENFVEHTIEKSFAEPSIWRVEKPGRVAVFNGKQSLLWIKSSYQIIETEGFSGFFGELNNYLLEPKDLLEKAHKLAKSKGAKIDLQEKGNEIVLTIEAKAQGDFTNDYLKNSSINESDNRQIYVFDKTTKLLKQLEIAVWNEGKYVDVMKTESISYNLQIDKDQILNLPDNLEKKVINNDLKNNSLKNITAKQAVEKMLNALKNKDITLVKEGFAQYPEQIFKKYHFYGLEILEIGESFKSGQYPGEFVPVKVRLSDGSVKSTNLAVRNDNKNKVWILDGGI